MKRVEALGLWCLLGSRKGGNHGVGRIFIREMLVTLLGYTLQEFGTAFAGTKEDSPCLFNLLVEDPLDRKASDTFKNATCEICTASASLPMLSYVLRRGRLRHCMYDVLFFQVCLDPSNIVLLLRCQQI